MRPALHRVVCGFLLAPLAACGGAAGRSDGPAAASLSAASTQTHDFIVTPSTSTARPLERVVRRRSAAADTSAHDGIEAASLAGVCDAFVGRDVQRRVRSVETTECAASPSQTASTSPALAATREETSDFLVAELTDQATKIRFMRLAERLDDIGKEAAALVDARDAFGDVVDRGAEPPQSSNGLGDAASDRCFAGSQRASFDVGVAPVCAYASRDDLLPGDRCRTIDAKTGFDGRTTCRRANLATSTPAAYAIEPDTDATLVP